MVKEKREQVRIEKEAKELSAGLHQLLESGDLTREQLPGIVSRLNDTNPYKAYIVSWLLSFSKQG